MKITKAYLLLVTVLLLTAIYIVSQILQYDVLANTARSLILPFATGLYYINAKEKSFYFKSFLIIFSISELMGLLMYTIDSSYMFFIGNSLYIIAYIFLILDVLSYIKRSKDYRRFFIKYALHIAIMVMLDAYVIMLLGEIVRPHMDNIEYSLSMVYSTTTLVLLTAALLNFFCNDTKRSFIIFLASLCIVFSEIVQLAYYYLSETSSLSIIYSVLLVIAFYLFYSQALIKCKSNHKLNLFRD